jgi:hypothetical protein
MRTIIAFVSLTLVWFSTDLATAQREVLERLEKSPRHHEFVDIEAPGGRKVKNWIF